MKGNKHILTPGWVMSENRNPFSPELPIETVNKKIYHGRIKYHYWVSYRHGYAMSTENKCPSNTNGYKYMGFSYDEQWPKKMSTGRILNKEIFKRKKKNTLAVVRKN